MPSFVSSIELSSYAGWGVIDCLAMAYQKMSRPVAILGGLRLPFCKAGTVYQKHSALDLMSECLSKMVAQYGLAGRKMGDVALGTVFFHPESWNFARDAVLRSGLAPESPAVGIQRACATSLDSAVWIANKIAWGTMEVGIAGGAESISDVAVYHHRRFANRLKRSAQAKSFGKRMGAWWGFGPSELKPQTPAPQEPTTGKLMGEHCELMAQEWEISREAQDTLALASHQNAARAYESGFYSDLVAAFENIERDNIVRGETSLEKLVKLRPAFEKSAKGTLTAGNSSPLTDGAACVLMSSENWAKAHGFEPWAYLTDTESAAVDIKQEGLLMAPAYAVPTMLGRRMHKLQDFDYYEIHEAFAAQVLCTLKAWESETFASERLRKKEPLGAIDRAKLNVCGGSVAVGHPFGATGARILATLAKNLKQKGQGRGLVSICAGGGMGTAAMLER